MRKLKTSITKRLFLYITALVIGISTLILLSNTLLLRPLYYSMVKNTMLHAMDILTDMDYTQERDIWGEEIRAQIAGNSYDVMIHDEKEILWSSSPEFGFAQRPLSSEAGQQDSFDLADMPPASLDNPSITPDNNDYPQNEDWLKQDSFLHRRMSNFTQVGDDIYIGTIKEPKSEIEMMVCTKSLENGFSIYISQAIEPINQSVQQANILLLACATLTLGVSMYIVFKMSKRFTRPIRQIQNTVGELAALNFGSKCDVTTGDELQSLGEDINHLGDELKNALMTLRKQNMQLEKDIIAQRQFISNASHELRTPLALIKGYADEMNAGFASTEQQKDFYIEIIAEEAAKMSRLLKEMLDLSRMESGRTEIINAKLSVKERIMSFIDKYDGFIAQNGLSILLDLEENDFGIFDAMRFEQVLANYVSNAARYGDERKQVRISTRVLDETIRISVFNTGKHLCEDMMENIWKSFYKADDARTRVKDSYGLGLSVVKAIQTVMGQHFGVENVQDGVIFWFDVKRFRER